MRDEMQVRFVIPPGTCLEPGLQLGFPGSVSHGENQPKAVVALTVALQDAGFGKGIDLVWQVRRGCTDYHVDQ